MRPETEALAVFWRNKRFWLIQTLLVTIWAALTVSWFWLPDSKIWGVVAAFVQAWPVIFGALILIASSFIFYGRAHAGSDASLPSVYLEGLRRTPVLLLWAAVCAAGVWLALLPAAPRWTWLAPPMLLLPLAARAATEGPRGLFRLPWRLRYFPDFVLLAVAGVYLPYLLIRWRPEVAGVGSQTASFALRFGLAYLLAVTAWLLLASLLARLGTATSVASAQTG